MSHLEPDELPDWNDDNDALEQQLRGLRPTPAQPWSAISESIDGSQTELATNRAPVSSSVLPAVLSHSLTAAIGLAVGVGAMLLIQQRSDSATTQAAVATEELHVGVELAAEQPATETPLLVEESPTVPSTNQSLWRPHRFGNTDVNNVLRDLRPLTVFGAIDARLVRSDDWPKQHEINELNSSDESDGDDDQPDDMPVERPVLSPRSFHLFFNDLSCSTADKLFPTAKGSRS